MHLCTSVTAIYFVGMLHTVKARRNPIHPFVTLKCSYSDSLTDVSRRFDHCGVKMYHIRHVVKDVTLTRTTQEVCSNLFGCRYNQWTIDCGLDHCTGLLD